MKKTQKNKKNLPIIGSFPLFYNLAETGRAVLIAKKYMERGGKVIFFSHGGEYEYLAEEIGCDVVKVKPIYSDEFIDLLWKSSRLETFKNPFNKKNLRVHINEEVKAFKKTNIKLIVSTNNFPCVISARVAKIPLIFVTPKVKLQFTKYPEYAEFFFTRIIPYFVKIRFLNWYAPKSKGYVKPFTKIAKEYKTPIPKKAMDVNKGDVTIYTNVPELMELKKENIPNDEIYVGPILLEELFRNKSKSGDTKKEEKEIFDHIARKGKSVLFTLGSSGTKKIYIDIINTLNKTDYNVIAVYANILKEDELPNVNDNILLKKYVPSIKKINEKVDLVIMHGGQGTVFTAAYSGKPVIGFPMQFEQHLNLEMLSKNGSAIIASKSKFSEKNLLNHIKEIFDNYDKYLKNAEKIVERLPTDIAHIRSANIIVDYLNNKEKYEKKIL
jgi:UDP:flavonoid glycosyltransferase YjiC (YdhE family)